MLLELMSVGFSFDTLSVLEMVNLTVNPGDLVILQGPNGSGKTTLLNLIAGFYPPRYGEIHYAADLLGHATTLLGRNRAINRNVFSYMSARYSGPTHISGQKYVEAIAGMRGMEKRVIQDNIEKYAASLLSQNELRNEVHNYSTGMIRKMHFLSAIISEPLLLLLDEPFDNVDAEAKQCMMRYMSLLQAQGSGIICVTHGFHPEDFPNYRLYTMEHRKLISL